jgi:hypothetical protein
MELAEWEMNVERQTFKSVAYKKAARALASLDYRYFHVTCHVQVSDTDRDPVRIEFGSRSGSSTKFTKKS